MLYNIYGKNSFDPAELEKRIEQLMQDDDVQKRSGIYEYLPDGKEKHLHIRAFTDSMKRKVYEKQKGACPMCKEEKRAKVIYDITEMEADHITPWSAGGKTVIENCQMLCREHNREKSSK